MKQIGLQFFTNTEWTIVAMILFMTVFVGYLIWIFSKSSTSTFHYIQKLPLENEVTHDK